MKFLSRPWTIAIAAFLVSAITFSCEEDEPTGENILPQDIVVEVPDGLTRSGSSGARALMDDELSGGHIYVLLTVFVEIAEESTQVIEDILHALVRHRINGVMDVTFTSDDDGRQKRLVVREDFSFENVAYEFALSVTDVESGNIGMQMYWNTTEGNRRGVVQFDLYEFDRANNSDAGDTRIQIEFGETHADYDKYMIVSIAGFPLDAADEFSVDNLKMFVGKTGDIVDVYGNTNHPNATFFHENTGMNWAFVASGNDATDIAVAEVGLPPITAGTSDRDFLLKDNSIHAVFSALILSEYPNAPQELIDALLSDTEAPGFFANQGFEGAADSPGSEYDVHVSRIENLSPYNPTDIDGLSIDFNENIR